MKDLLLGIIKQVSFITIIIIILHMPTPFECGSNDVVIFCSWTLCA